MKYAIIIPDGSADEPIESLGGRTPLQAAAKPAMDAVAAAGRVGMAWNVPASLPACSSVANMSLLGYDPLQFYTGRAPIEAAAQGIDLGADDWAIRCNLVTIENQTMRDFTAGHISTDEAAQLIEALQQAWNDSPCWKFFSGVSYRNLLVYRAEPGRPAPFSLETRATQPHDLTDQSVIDAFPRGPGSERLTEIMESSIEVFREHPVNRARLAAGKLPATNVWLWGVGRRPNLQPFAERFGKQGKMITAVDLLRGLARLIGWEVIRVPGATGYTDTDYAAKGRYAVEALRSDADLVCVHVEAPDEAAHEGDLARKIEAIEQIDRHVVAPILEELRRAGEYRILVSPDHPTPISTKTHNHGPVPFAYCGSDVEADAAEALDETAAASTGLQLERGSELMERFLGVSE